ncbi:protein of unknown function [Candidatus Promineifilum breve]|uniref:Uncharacterized protein n=1 Tax=Candidatus Promineifilum breve TaxID=1806508 RepID=A0A160T7S5_9CHLR|nr:protein of unknown function [Candidatus Promineifilum breve]
MCRPPSPQPSPEGRGELLLTFSLALSRGEREFEAYAKELAPLILPNFSLPHPFQPGSYKRVPPPVTRYHADMNGLTRHREGRTSRPGNPDRPQAFKEGFIRWYRVRSSRDDDCSPSVLHSILFAWRIL